MKKKLFLITASLISITLLGVFSTRYYHKRIYRPHLTIMGFANMHDGIGRQSVEIIDTLKDSLSIRFYPTQASKMADVPQAVQAIMKKPSHQL